MTGLPHPAPGWLRAWLLTVAVVGAASAAGAVHDMAFKARTIVIPKLELEDTGVEEAFQILHRESRRLDEAGTGVNFLLKLDPSPEARWRRYRVTMSFTKLRLEDAIRYVCLATALGYRFEKAAILVADGSLPLSPMQTRFYSIQPGVFDAAPTRRARRDLIEDDDNGND